LVAAGAFAWLGPAEKPQEATSHLPSRGPRLFPVPALLFIFLAATFLLSARDFAGSGLATSASLFFQNAHGLNPGTTGLALSGIFIASAISNPLFGHFSDRGRIRWMFIVLVIAALMVALFPRVPLGWSVPVLLTYGFFFMAGYPITEAALMESVPDSVRGRVFGLFITIGGFVGNLAHYLIGHWAGTLAEKQAPPSGYLGLYGTLAGLILVSLAALPFLHALKRGEQATNPPAPAPLPSSAKT
jgi:MFS family permease